MSPNSLVEVTCRTLQARFLLKPHHGLNPIIVHNAVTVRAGDHGGLERLARYLLRPPLSLERLTLEPGACPLSPQESARAPRRAIRPLRVPPNGMPMGCPNGMPHAFRARNPVRLPSVLDEWAMIPAGYPLERS